MRKTGAGSTLPKPRISAAYVGDHFCSQTLHAGTKDEKTVSTFTTLANYIKSKDFGNWNADDKDLVKNLQLAAFEKAGTQDLSSLNGSPIEFKFNLKRVVDDGNTVQEKTVDIKIVPTVKS
jgi:hypothetical protein